MPPPDDEMDDAIAISALQHYSYCPRQGFARLNWRARIETSFAQCPSRQVCIDSPALIGGRGLKLFRIREALTQAGIRPP